MQLSRNSVTLAHLIKTKAGCNDDSEENFTPGLVIVSLSGQLINLRIEGYIHDFLNFKHRV